MNLRYRRSKQIESRKTSFLSLFKKVGLMYLLLFSAGYVTTHTTAYLTDHQETNGSVSIGEWEIKEQEEGEGN